MPYIALPCSVYPQCHNPLYEATDFNRFIKFSLFLLLNIYELSGKRYNDIMACTTWPIITYSHWKRRLQNHSQTSQPLIGENCVLIKKISTTLNYTYKMQSSLASYNSFLVMSNMFACYGARAKPFIWFKINPRVFFVYSDFICWF